MHLLYSDTPAWCRHRPASGLATGEAQSLEVVIFIYV